MKSVKEKRTRFGAVVILVLIGLVFRFLLIELIPQGFMLDQGEYHQVAEGILQNGIFVSSYRTYGYPILLALVYRFFGTEATLPWKVLQIVLDTAVGLLVFAIAKRLFRNFSLAFIAAMITMLNPFTAAYTGVRLSEVSAIFLMTATYFLTLEYIRTQRTVTLLILALTIGFLPQVRPSFVLFSVVAMLYMLLRLRRIAGFRRRTVLVLLSVSTFILPFLYNIVGNVRAFNSFSPLTAHNMFIREFYISLFTGNGDLLTSFPQEVRDIYQEYTVMTFPEYRRVMQEKYWNLAVAYIRTNPHAFFVRRVQKLWYVWEKHRIYPYTNTYPRAFDPVVYWGNVAFLAVSVIGLAQFIKTATRPYARLFGYLVAALIVYISVIHAFTFTTGRFSLPAYPVLSVFTGYGCLFFWEKLRRYPR